MSAAPAEPPAPAVRTRRARGEAGARRPVYDASSLLTVAVAEFNTRGYDATSMEDLSRAAGITKSSFYHHVSGKEELLRAALHRALDGLFGILEEPAAQDGPALARLQHIIRRQVEVLTSELPYVTLLLRVRGNTETERWALARRRAFDASIASLVAEAVADGEVRSGVDPLLAARLLSGTVNSIIEWYRPGRPGTERLPDDIVRVVSDGIIPPA
ncbi:TetR family transcriptional regulator [Pseudonocardia sp. KRD-184]|uniref:TetR family transcriptional regulator n=1 Tax=Pseudonocardia oceani TaxID=2792013 RepID=A0ABS6U4Z1_9PSEU|nr:TetR/AcrR family transcriptional regulator [Pseudonocardia oceani]MBW0091102.1 TetR family transcriptional regulator [Pseudonocardia oceani]MBW0096063.1 TetR family transcriptional regulator [Pseudonocardia oceani]MBW0108779.1 TetR family transcriptional regulator [Pseudonocardia oceani]MBW0121055.1 TetR family transcriptional regulator [Pseudonocardia oceani]MBW0126974.1 TetR family transcriptional regulator [Pseudonocardia oceani]